MICKNCGSIHNGAQALPGSGWIELVLWLCYLVPGAIYSIWRRTQRRAVCPACGSRDLVGLDTPVGHGLVRQFHGGVAPPAAVPPERPRRAPTRVLGAVLVGVLVCAPFLLLLL